MVARPPLPVIQRGTVPQIHGHPPHDAGVHIQRGANDAWCAPRSLSLGLPWDCAASVAPWAMVNARIYTAYLLYPLQYYDSLFTPALLSSINPSEAA